MEQFSNNALDVLDGSINGSQTTLAVLDASEFPTTGPFAIVVDNELMRVTGVAGTMFTVVRGDEGSTATSHSSGARVGQVVTARSLKAIVNERTSIVDTFANRPSAAEPGRLFLPTDGPVIQRDTGSIWAPYGPLFRFKPHAVADYSWVNQGSAYATDRAGAVALSDPAHNSENFRLLTKSAPGTPFKVTVAMRPFIDSNSTAARLFFGVLGRESASGKFVGAGFLFGGAEKTVKPTMWKYTSPTSFSAQSSTYPWGGPRDVLWARYEDTGTDRILSVSMDGFTWGTILSETRTTFCTADQVGIGLNNNQSTSPFFDSSVLFLSYEES